MENITETKDEGSHLNEFQDVNLKEINFSINNNEIEDGFNEKQQINEIFDIQDVHIQDVHIQDVHIHDVHIQDDDLDIEKRLRVCSCSSDDENVFRSPEEWPDRMRQLEDEQEQLNSSLLALTSHFAQVQLRLKQIVDAGTEEREILLKELEEFAFRGIPDSREVEIGLIQASPNQDLIPITNEDKLEQQRLKQKELIEKLKEQLEDLEKYAYETGDINSIPSSMLLERQTVIIEQLKGKLPLNLDELDKLSPEDLRKQVDQAIRDLVNPVIMKEQLVGQLKTQITDLERFIEFLQGTNDGCSNKCTCDCPMHGNSQKAVEPYSEIDAQKQKLKFRRNNRARISNDDNERAIRMIKRALTLLQVFTMAQFGCGVNGNQSQSNFQRNIFKKTPKGNHWGDYRARLEMAINKIVEIDKEKCSNDSDYTSDSDDEQQSSFGYINHHNERLLTVVRKELAPALRDLLQHGLIGVFSGEMISSSSLFSWGCFSSRSHQVAQSIHAWDVILKYYELKNGFMYNASPARKLSQSFNLEIIGGVAITSKQMLLSCVHEIIDSHTKLKRSPDSHFKAFICYALNESRLVQWLKLIVKSRSIIESCYFDWSYVVSTGFDDALRSLDRLTNIKFRLPTDLAVRQLQNISDAF